MEQGLAFLRASANRADEPIYSTQYRQANRRGLSKRVHHNPYSIEDADAASKRMHSYSALDYEEPHSDIQMLAQLKKSSKQQWIESFMNWATFWALGMTVGIVAFLVKSAVGQLTALKFAATQSLLDEGLVGSAFGVFLVTSLGYGLLSTLLIVFVEPSAAGSGIPEVKAFLNGTNTPRFLTPIAGLVKVVGICFSVSSGLIIGREGPLIHIGAICGNLLSTRPGAPKRWKGLFRADRHKRDFVSAGAAAGVAGAFSSPVGGICFAFEEASSFWRLSLTWRTFLCTMLTTSTQWILDARTGEVQSSFWGLLKYGKFDNYSLFKIYEIPLLAGLGVIGGLAGSLFCGLNAKLSIWRASHVAPYKMRRVLEVLLVVAITATASFWAPFLLDGCRDAQADYHCTHRQNRYYCGGNIPMTVPMNECPTVYNCTDMSIYVSHGCPEGQFNTMATLTFQNLDGVIHAFFHDPARFDPLALLVYFVGAFVLALVTYGCAVPSGLFVPCILMGSAFGRLWGELLRDTLPVTSDITPGVYALVGAAAMLSGVTRITVTLSVILFETTNQVYLITPIMLTVLIAKWIADHFNISLYDIHIALKCLPFVEPDPPLALQGLTAREIMAAPCVTLQAHGTVHDLTDTLRSCSHNGFAVVDHEGRFCGCILRNQLVVLLKRKKWKAAAAPQYPEQLDLSELLMPTDFDAESTLQSKQRSIDNLEIDAPGDAIVDLRPYLNPAIVTVTELCPVARCFALFRALGIRHMPVLSLDHHVVGMITRHEVSTDFSKDLH